MRLGHLKPMAERAREPYRTVPIPRGSLLRTFLLSALLCAVLIALAFIMGGCDDNGTRTGSSTRHCDMLYERGHLQPCRSR